MYKGVLLTKWNAFTFFICKLLKKTPCIELQGVSLIFIVDCGE